MKISSSFLVLGIASATLMILACRTADLLGGLGATSTRPPATRAALRATFTPLPTETDTPVPTDTPPPTETPAPTDTPEPTEPPVPTPRPATRRPPTPIPPTNTTIPPSPQPSPTLDLPWALTGSPTCTTGSSTESAVVGKITANSKAAVGQFVQASSGPGGAPISDFPAQTDSNGNYKVTFICGGSACNGDFWIWMVDAGRHQISPFVEFSFNSSCRKGTANFQKR